MNLKSNFQSAMTEFKTLEAQYKQRCELGSEDPLDYHWMSYFGGILNGMKFVWSVLDNNMTQKEFDENLKDLKKTYQERIN